MEAGNASREAPITSDPTSEQPMLPEPSPGELEQAKQKLAIVKKAYIELESSYKDLLKKVDQFEQEKGLLQQDRLLLKKEVQDFKAEYQKVEKEKSELIAKMEKEHQDKLEMQKQIEFMHHQEPEAKIVTPEDLIRRFTLPSTEHLLGSFSCNLTYLRGWLYISESYVCFKSLYFQCSLKVPIEEISSLNKRSWVKSLESIEIAVTNGKTYSFDSFSEGKRDEVYNSIKKICANIVKEVAGKKDKGRGQRYSVNVKLINNNF